MTTFDELLAHLARAGVEFAVVGGVAVGGAGYVRATEGVDLLVEASEPNLRRLPDALRPFSPAAADELSPADFPLEEGAVRVREAFDVDLFTQIGGHTYADLLPLTTSHVALGVPILYLNAEGFIRLKAPSLRPKDRLDSLPRPGGVQVLRRLQAEPHERT